MKGTIMYSQAELDRIVSMLRSVEASIGDAEAILATVDTSAPAGGDEMTSDVVPMARGAGFRIPSYTWDYTVRGRVQAQIHYLRDQAEKVTQLIRAVERVSALFQETENRLRSLDPDTALPGWNPGNTYHGPYIVGPPHLGFDENGNVIVTGPSDVYYVDQNGNLVKVPRDKDGNLVDPGNFWGDLAVNFFNHAIYGAIGAALGVNWETSFKVKSPIDLIKGNWDDGAEGKGFNLGIGVDGKAVGTIWKGKKEGSTDWGKGSAELSVGEFTATGGIGATLFQDGKFSPEVYGKVGAEFNAVHGSAEGQIGSDEYNVHGSVDGKVGGAYAKAQGSIGLEGVKGEAGAGAYIAKGEIKGGVTLFGIKVNVKGEAALGVEAKVKGGASTKGAEGKVNVGPFGLGIEIDWSGFKMPKMPNISLPSFNPLSLLA